MKRWKIVYALPGFGADEYHCWPLMPTLFFDYEMDAIRVVALMESIFAGKWEFHVVKEEQSMVVGRAR